MTLPPVIWKKSPNFGAMSRGTTGRGGNKILGWVDHRIVGTLAGADGRFAKPEEWASAHFGIGHIDGVLEIHQFVNLSDTAWTNGDVRDPTWAPVLQNPGVNPNMMTVTVEHEDGGASNDGVVEPDIWAASIELTVLCTSGDIAAIRAAGIRIRDDSTAAQMAAIPKDATGFIDHHQISGPNKPYCWRPWLDDPGFVNGNPSRRDELLTALNAVDGITPLELCQKRLRRVRRDRDALVQQLEEALQDAEAVPRLRRKLALAKSIAEQITEL